MDISEIFFYFIIFLYTIIYNHEQTSTYKVCWMPDKKFDQVKDEVVRHGGYYVHFYFDMHSKNPESLQNIMVGFVGKLTKEAGVEVAVGEIDKPIEDGGMYSTTAKVSLLIVNFSSLVRVTMSYAPIAVDVQEPLDAKIDAGELQNALLGISATAQDLTTHIISKGLEQKDKENFTRQMVKKAELGKKVRDEMQKNGGEKKE